nr:PREDICTED: uncharacterized protein LOC105663658 [Megachile rotundata]
MSYDACLFQDRLLRVYPHKIYNFPGRWEGKKIHGVGKGVTFPEIGNSRFPLPAVIQPKLLTGDPSGNWPTNYRNSNPKDRLNFLNYMEPKKRNTTTPTSGSMCIPNRKTDK